MSQNLSNEQRAQSIKTAERITMVGTFPSYVRHKTLIYHRMMVEDLPNYPNYFTAEYLPGVCVIDDLKAGCKYVLKSDSQDSQKLSYNRLPDKSVGREIAALLALHRVKEHENIISLYGHGKIKLGDYNQYFAVLEYIDGRTLDKPLASELKLKAILEICQALQHCHENGIIHCDIKPENMMQGYDSGGTCGKSILMDFDISMTVEDAIKRKRFIGTVGYAAPELFDGACPSKASDIYGFGISMHQILSGNEPFEGYDYSEVTRIHKKGATMWLKPLPSEIPEKIKNIIGKAVELNPDNRLPVEEINEEIKKELGKRVKSAPDKNTADKNAPDK